MSARLAVAAALLAGLAAAAAPARAEIWVLIDNPNNATTKDAYEVYDRVCDRSLPTVTVPGRSSAGIEVCGGIGEPGSIKIRFAGESEWLTVNGLHSWSNVEAPRRPPTLRKPSPALDDD